MDKYARLMQKLEVVNVEFFKVGCSAFNCFTYFTTFCSFLSLCYIFSSTMFFPDSVHFCREYASCLKFFSILYMKHLVSRILIQVEKAQLTLLIVSGIVYSYSKLAAKSISNRLVIS